MEHANHRRGERRRKSKALEIKLRILTPQCRGVAGGGGGGVGGGGGEGGVGEGDKEDADHGEVGEEVEGEELAL
ncbi:hypothetical protein CsSME_00035399 [Camellia sinensis var. sinensis]